MYLADYGVDVVKVELPAGDGARATPPLVKGVGQAFLAFNRGKRSAVIDWRLPEGQRQAERLLEDTDVFIVDEPVGPGVEWPFRYERVRELNPRLIYAAVTPFGQTGPYAWLPGYDPLVQAASGVMASSRTREGLPVAAGYRLAGGATPMLLVHGIMLALLARRRTGRGQRVDVSMFETAIAMQSVQLAWAEDDPVSPSDPFQPTVACYRCSDGRFINITTIQQRQFQGLCRVLDLEHLLAEPEHGDRYQRRAALHPLFEGIFETRPSGEWLEQLNDAGVPCGPMLSRRELFTDPQVIENGLAARVAHPAGGRVHVLGSPVCFSETSPKAGDRVPKLGEHTAGVLSEAGGIAATAAADPERARGVGAPLEGIRVLDLAGMYAGPGTAAYLGDMGADVIKIEAPTLDDSRRLGATDFLGPNSRAFMAVNRNKRGMVLDLRQPKAREVLYRLAGDADVIIHNFRPSVPERLGLDYPTLNAMNPRLIYAWVTAFGSRGPYRLKPAYDNIIQGYSGVYEARARRDGEPTGAGTFVSDTALPMLLGFAIGAALWAREHTGRGQLLEASLLGLALATQSPEWVALAEAATDAGASLDPLERACPVLACADGAFMTVALVTDGEWQALCLALGRRDWLRDGRFQRSADRVSHRAELDQLLGPVFQEQAQTHWLELLWKAGVPSAPVVARNDLPRDPHVLQHGLFTPLHHPAAGATRVFSVPVRLSETPGSIRLPAPRPGQDTDAILGGAGYSPQEIRALRDEAVVA